MELDELKSQLKHKLATDHAGRSDADIAQLLQKRTSSVVEKLKRSLMFEIRLSIPFIVIFALIGMFAEGRSIRIYFTIFTFLLAGVALLLLYLYKRTRELSSSLLPVKDNLQTIVKIIDEFIKRCFQLSVWMIPVCVLFLTCLEYGFNESPTASAKLEKRFFNESWQTILFIVAYTAVFMTAMYFFAKWYLHKMYGRYVAQLKECIAELEE